MLYFYECGVLYNRFMEGNLIIISFIDLCNLQISIAFSIIIDGKFKLIAYFKVRKSFISNLLIDNHYCCQYPYVTVNQSRTSPQQSKVPVLKFSVKSRTSSQQSKVSVLKFVLKEETRP